MVSVDPTEEKDPMASTTTTTTTTPAQQAIEQIVLELLANLLKKDPEELRTELLAGGTGMPVDSLDMLDILVEFRKRTNITIPKRKLRRRTMRSIGAFAEFAAKEGQQ
jgi:acyl carrier protein